MEILKINSGKPSKIKMTRVADMIKQGKVVIFPTDTVYIPVADATSKKAVDKVFRIKQRPKQSPIPIFVKDMRMAKKLAKIDKKQRDFLKRVWPGRITAVLKRKKSKIKIYGIEKKTIALRIPDSKMVRFLLEKLNIPLVGTSANISGQPSSGDIEEVLRQFKGKKHQPDLTVDAGNILKSKPSTVLDFVNWPPKILRP